MPRRTDTLIELDFTLEDPNPVAQPGHTVEVLCVVHGHPITVQYCEMHFDPRSQSFVVSEPVQDNQQAS